MLTNPLLHFTMFGFKKRRLDVRVFENGIQKDLSSYSDTQLSELQKAIYSLLPKSPTSAVIYEVYIYEVFQGLLKPRKTTLEVVALTHYNKKISVPKHLAEVFTQKRHLISPQATLASRWPEKMEVEFAV